MDLALGGGGGIGGLGGLLKPGFEAAHVEVARDDFAIVDCLGAEVGFEGDALVAMVEGLDGLLKTNSDDEADDDGGDVNEEVAPGVGGFVGRVDVEQRGLLGPARTARCFTCREGVGWVVRGPCFGESYSFSAAAWTSMPLRLQEMGVQIEYATHRGPARTAGGFAWRARNCG